MNMTRRKMLGFLGAGSVLAAFPGCVCPPPTRSCAAKADAPWLYPQSTTERAQTFLCKGMRLCDFHIHLRGGMTVEKALARERASGIASAFIANHGRGWEIDTNEKLNAFIDTARATGLTDGRLIRVGAQVNDRDWYRQIDAATRSRLDFILADALIMDGQKLWEDFPIPDPEAWMERYFAHNMQILDEPITILANPTYLPKPLESQWDNLWTDTRLKALFAKAKEKGIALEVQAESPFQQHPRYVKFARESGCLISLGTNNFDDKALSLDAWFSALDALDLPPSRLLAF